MSILSDEELLHHHDRVKGKVVIVTGGGNGIGKEVALTFAQYGSKIVIGDRDLVNAEKVVAEIKTSGGQAIALRCDVTVFDEQVELFEQAIKAFGVVDIVVANAGVNELGSMHHITLGKDGKPLKPTTTTLNVNVYGVVYSSYLSQHYMKIGQTPDSLKAIIMIGSIASWRGVPMGAQYSASKHAVLGLMRSMHPILELQGIRTASIHPWFADTGIIPPPIRVLMTGLPYTPVPRIAGAIFYAASHPDPSTSGCGYLLLDDGPVSIVKKDEFKEGIYSVLDARVNRLFTGGKGLIFWGRFVRDIAGFVFKPALVVGAGYVAAKYGRPALNYIQSLL